MKPDDHRDDLRLAAGADRAAQRYAAETRQQLRQAALDTLAAGVTEVEVANLAGVTRMTIRTWAGK